ncbi:hypothetical protein [Pleionea sp. CnH1-48]|uniref:transglycosylase SLT domain-containing protein n=1 Tax=Pleionea sp. CnH1-48 TaxID=2954494 RepID=UPI002097B170|nr:hypothetical protein [Pleionea sp. CnH1-48]MCO7225725.1 hypothetical protein [Pleionea sp. CnH1-48]
MCILISCLLLGCSTYRPSNANDLCSIFRGETDWYEDAVDANERWGTPIWVMMAIMKQESSFRHDVHAPRDYLLGFIPWGYKSSAYGFAQAKDEVWGEYRAEVNSGGSRDDFGDAIDFIGWYTHKTQRRLNISKWDAYNQYLAYHEGRGGYSRGTYRSKGWLINVAKKVKLQAARYNTQLKTCKSDLDDAIDGWFF